MARFTEQPAPRFVAEIIGASQHLDGYAALQLRVHGLEYQAHAARADLRNDLISAQPCPGPHLAWRQSRRRRPRTCIDRQPHPKEAADLPDEYVERGLLLEQQMITTVERHELRSSDSEGQLTTEIERRYGVAAGVQHQRRRRDRRQHRGNVDVARCRREPDRIGGRRRDTLELVVPALLLQCCFRNESRGPHLPEGRVLLPPPVAHQREHRLAHA
jgi:hypothetical protein